MKRYTGPRTLQRPRHAEMDSVGRCELYASGSGLRTSGGLLLTSQEGLCYIELNENSAYYSVI
jgi:hypothetical protein